MQPQLLLTCLVLKANRIGIAVSTPRAGAAQDAALRLVGRQLPGRHRRCVGHHGGDDGPVGVAIKKLHNHFTANARNAGSAKVRPTPGGGYPYPGRAFVVKLTDAVPVKLHPHPAILVSVNLLPRRADHQSGLQAVDFGLNGVVAAPWVPGDGFADTGEAVAVVGGLLATCSLPWRNPRKESAIL
jgi:hypothetical protein